MIAFSLLLVTGVAKIGEAMKAVRRVECWTGQIVGMLFIETGGPLLRGGAARVR